MKNYIVPSSLVVPTMLHNKEGLQVTWVSAMLAEEYTFSDISLIIYSPGWTSKAEL